MITFLIFSYTREDIYFVEPSLQYVVVFTVNKRGDKGGVTRYYPRNYNPNYVMYARPFGYKWSVCKDPENKDRMCLDFPDAYSFSVLQKDTVSIYISKITELEDNEKSAIPINVDKNDSSIYVFKASGKIFKGLYEELAMVVVLPLKFEIVGYYSTSQGNWRQVANTLAYYGSNVPSNKVYVFFKVKEDTFYRELVKLIEEEREKREEITIERTERGLLLRLPESVLFESGSAEIKESGKELIREIYKKIDFSNIKELRVEGHTDSIPIIGKLAEKYPTNWELSTARSSAVVRYLIELGAPKEKLAAVGYADARPIATNSTIEGRAKNRRVEFIIINEERKVQ
ncbi:MAG: OmpA family protein [candidate division WOR-3 bacterium]|nr:OmpA family protein [candidate division WOR-3 bacterium]MCX7948147.1 OmpA family protein [candidate division WOR-3 bacterium]MDW8151044.1 OmpA family protein [candidate division WOR-3 bacterium]